MAKLELKMRSIHGSASPRIIASVMSASSWMKHVEHAAGENTVKKREKTGQGRVKRGKSVRMGGRPVLYIFPALG